MKEKNKITFHFGWAMSLLPMAIFLITCILFFIVFKSFDMNALAVGGFLGLLVGALFTKTYGQYWNSVVEGIGKSSSISIIVVLLLIGMFTKLMAVSGVSQGFLWLADKVGLYGGLFTAFTFLTTCLITAATGSSIGTLFTAYPILYPAGIALGSNPGVLAGAILSGAVFGDNLAPISDVTIASTGTQTYKYKEETADIGGTVAYRLKYALISGAIALVLFAIFGGSKTEINSIGHDMMASMNAKGLWMLIPVVVLLIISIKTSDIFKAITGGLISGILIGLLTGAFTANEIFSISEGQPVGFLYNGFNGMVGICLFCISLFGIMGVMEDSGALDKIIGFFLNSNMAKTPRGTEILIALGSMITTLFLGGVTSASVLTFGPVADAIGKKHDLHPYRRANILSCFANSFPAITPFISAFIFISISVIMPLQSEYSFIPSISASQIFLGCFYPMVMFLVLMASILTGWDRKFETKEEIKWLNLQKELNLTQKTRKY